MEKSILLSVCLLAALSFLVACGPTPVDESALAKGGGHRLYRTNGPGAGLYPHADGDIYANRYPHANVYAYPHTYPYCYTHFHSRADAHPYSHIHFHGRADAYASTSPSLRGVEEQNPQSTAAYEPCWQPGGGWIVFTSADDGDDEIWRVTNDGEWLQQLTYNDWEYDKFPSWSPDGQQIAFWSNRLVGRPQIWVMDLDGQRQRNISNNEFSDWDPVWVVGKKGPAP